jgi:Flp pilus assembly pilin Flp
MLRDAALRTLIALQDARARLQGERGQTLAEYSLIISAIAVATITICVIAFRESIVGAWNSASDCLNGSC